MLPLLSRFFPIEERRPDVSIFGRHQHHFVGARLQVAGSDFRSEPHRLGQWSGGNKIGPDPSEGSAVVSDTPRRIPTDDDSHQTEKSSCQEIAVNLQSREPR